MAAKFRVSSTFVIEGRGLALSGQILEGAVGKGMKIRVPSWPAQLTIAEVDSIRRLDRNPSVVGLVFTSNEKPDFARWRALDLKNQILQVEDEDWRCE